MQFTGFIDSSSFGGGAITGAHPAAMTPPHTVAAALPCQRGSADLWFAESAADIEQAKSLCQQCSLLSACLSGALAREEPWGVWGGQVFVDGRVVAVKRGRGRPRKAEIAA